MPPNTPENPQTDPQTPQPESVQTPPPIARERNSNRGEKRERTDPMRDGRERVDAVAKQILRDKYQANNETQLKPEDKPKYKQDVKDALEKKVKEDVETSAGQAERIRNELETGGIRPDSLDSAQNITEYVAAFIKAAEMGFIELPAPHEPSQAVLEDMIRVLRTHLDVRNASYFQPLISGLISEPEYIKFSEEGQEPTKLERDLKKMMVAYGTNEAELSVTEIFLNTIQKGKIPGMTAEKLQEKFKQSKGERKTQIEMLGRQMAEEVKAVKKLRKEGRERRGDPDEYVQEKLQSEIAQGVKEAEDALRLFESLETANDFYDFYQKEFNEILRVRLRQRPTASFRDP
jgi:hypothetical protein